MTDRGVCLCAHGVDGMGVWWFGCSERVAASGVSSGATCCCVHDHRGTVTQCPSASYLPANSSCVHPVPPSPPLTRRPPLFLNNTGC